MSHRVCWYWPGQYSWLTDMNCDFFCLLPVLRLRDHETSSLKTSLASVENSLALWLTRASLRTWEGLCLKSILHLRLGLTSDRWPKPDFGVVYLCSEYDAETFHCLSLKSTSALAVSSSQDTRRFFERQAKTGCSSKSLQVSLLLSSMSCPAANQLFSLHQRVRSVKASFYSFSRLDLI